MVDGAPWRVHRLRNRADVKKVYEQGCRSAGAMAVIFCLRRSDDGPWRLGLTATRRLGKAVQRNRVRRRAREFFRRRRDSILPGWDFVVNLRRAAISASASRFEREMSGALARLKLESALGAAELAGQPAPPPVN